MPRLLAFGVVLLAACGAAPRPAASVTPVESFPVETTLDHPEVPDAPAVWLEMIAGARRRIDLAEFYASEADTPALLADSKLAPVVAALEAALRRGVRVRFLADAKFARTYPDTLARLAAAGAAVRTLDVARTSGGVLHAKYFVVDAADLGAPLGERNADDVGIAHRNHHAVLALGREVGRLDAETGGEHPVEGARCATSLQVAEHRHPGLVAGELLDDGCE